jgi:hypothetical protein
VIRTFFWTGLADDIVNRPLRYPPMPRFRRRMDWICMFELRLDRLATSGRKRRVCVSEMIDRVARSGDCCTQLSSTEAVVLQTIQIEFHDVAGLTRGLTRTHPLGFATHRFSSPREEDADVDDIDDELDATGAITNRSDGKSGTSTRVEPDRKPANDPPSND